MFILDKPFVSDLIIDTIRNNKYPLLEDSAKEFNIENVATLNTVEAIGYLGKQEHPKLYSNSENAINWIAENLAHTNLPKQINAFKDKKKFRDLTAKMFPNFFYQGIAFKDIDQLNEDELNYPFIIKPSVGFFSMGVYKVDEPSQWKETLQNIHKEMEEVKNLYPLEVMDATDFIIEECIEGKEFAFDAYYNAEGKAIIVGIYEHMFSSGDDVSDRVYFTSKAIIESYLKPFTTFLQEVGDLMQLRNFPVHTEVRINKQGEIIPIEINPMRFGGWCTTADCTSYAYELNPYEYYFNDLQPDWDTLLKEKDEVIYSIIILNNSSGYAISTIERFDYGKLKNAFTKPLDLRYTDWKTYPLFGILFTESQKDNFNEVEEILTSDLKEFVILK